MNVNSDGSVSDWDHILKITAHLCSDYNAVKIIT